MQEAAWDKVLERGEAVAAAAKANANTVDEAINPWGLSYRDEAIKRMQSGVNRQMQPVLLAADRVRPLPARIGFMCSASA